MKNAKCVIGALWGDEAKGHMTDILSHSSNTIVVRFNGGAQASHTVVGSNHMVHAFKHHGSGTFNGAPTYLGKNFIVNVFQFALEREKLEKMLGKLPIIYVNPECMITTPYDEFINQAVETMRGKNRNGTCGLGINETVCRCETKYKIAISDFYFEDLLEEKLKLIRDEYLPIRLMAEYGLTIEDLPLKFRAKIYSENVIPYFLFFAKVFIRSVSFTSDKILNQFDNVIFEGAQGLMLDQYKWEMCPYVTTSNTGTTNIVETINSIGFKGLIEVNYMCRVYMTRHGAGPFFHELSEVPYEKVEDKNNVPNEYQGALRFSYMDYDVLSEAINTDLVHIQGTNAKVNVVFSCIDQLGDAYYYYNNGKFYEVPSHDVLEVSKTILEKKLTKLDNIYGITSIDATSVITNVPKNKKACA